MTKEEMAREVFKNLKIDKDIINPFHIAKEAVESVLNILKQTILDGEDIELRGFGRFCVRSKSARIGRNPMTGVETEITARKVVTFKPSRVLKSEVE